MLLVVTLETVFYVKTSGLQGTTYCVKQTLHLQTTYCLTVALNSSQPALILCWERNLQNSWYKLLPKAWTEKFPIKQTWAFAKQVLYLAQVKQARNLQSFHFHPKKFYCKYMKNSKKKKKKLIEKYHCPNWKSAEAKGRKPGWQERRRQHPPICFTPIYT